MNYCNPEGFRNEIKALRKGDIDAFYHWFDGGETKAGAFEKGVDVFHRVIYPYAKKYLRGRLKEDAVALDLGYGAGTKILPALKFFQIVYGVDVHEEWEFVLQSINVPKGKEVRLLKGDGYTIPTATEEIDFLYSWIVFCHLGTIDNVRTYLEEIHRVLRPGGIAVIFFTRLIRSGIDQSWKEVKADMEVEKTTEGFREGGPESKVRTINLVMSMWKMEELAYACDLQVIDKIASWDDSPEGRIFHGQYGVVLRKDQPESPSQSTSPVGNNTEEKSGPSESTLSTSRKEKTLKKTLAEEKRNKKKPTLKRSR